MIGGSSSVGDSTPTDLIPLNSRTLREIDTTVQPTFRTLAVTKGFLLNIFSTIRIKQYFTGSYSNIIYLP